MKLSAWAKANGLTYKTAWRMWRDGQLPVPAEQLATGTVLVHPPQAPSADGVALYARVSSADQKDDLERQLGRLADHASRERLMVVRSVSEIGSGLNGRRTKVMKLLADPAVKTIVVEHRDRLARFGSEYIEAALSAAGRKLVVVDETEMKDDLVQDMVDVRPRSAHVFTDVGRQRIALPRRWLLLHRRLRTMPNEAGPQNRP